MKKYRVWLRSKPGFYEQYSCNLIVISKDENDAIKRALIELKKTTFEDRSSDSWIVEKVEREL